MIWFILAIASYLLSATVRIIDKFLLSSRVRNPLTYAFYGATLTSFALLLWPFDFAFLSLQTTILAIISGICFFAAIYFLYAAMAKGETSRVISLIGGISPLIILVLSYFILRERLPTHWVIAFVSLILGSFILARGNNSKSSEFSINKKFPLYSICAAIFFALMFFTSKLVFMESSFLNGFIWLRVGTILSVFFVMLFPSARKSIFESPLNVSDRISLAFISNKALSALAFFLLNFSISRGSVTVINALQGVEYVFVFLLALIFSFLKPEVLKESFTAEATLQKIFGIALVSIGIAILLVF